MQIRKVSWYCALLVAASLGQQAGANIPNGGRVVAWGGVGRRRL